MKFEKKTYELNLEQFEATCVQLNAALQNKTYLVGKSNNNRIINHKLFELGPNVL